LGGSEALTFLAEVAFGGGQRLGQVFFDKFAGETGPSGEKSGVDSFDPGGWDRAAGSLMQILSPATDSTDPALPPNATPPSHPK